MTQSGDGNRTFYIFERIAHSNAWGVVAVSLLLNLFACLVIGGVALTVSPAIVGDRLQPTPAPVRIAVAYPYRIMFQGMVTPTLFQFLIRIPHDTTPEDDYYTVIKAIRDAQSQGVDVLLRVCYQGFNSAYEKCDADMLYLRDEMPPETGKQGAMLNGN